MNPISRFGRIGSSLALALLVGCSGTDEQGRVEVHPVSGKVTMAGAPVANAVVTYSPKGEQPVALARTDSEGRYALTTYESGDGAAAGEYVVLVIKEAPPAAAGPAAQHDPTGKTGYTPPMHSAAQRRRGSTGGTVLPERYSRADRSDLSVTVTADGPNEHTLDLKP